MLGSYQTFLSPPEGSETPSLQTVEVVADGEAGKALLAAAKGDYYLGTLASSGALGVVEDHTRVEYDGAARFEAQPPPCRWSAAFVGDTLRVSREENGALSVYAKTENGAVQESAPPFGAVPATPLRRPPLRAGRDSEAARDSDRRRRRSGRPRGRRPADVVAEPRGCGRGAASAPRLTAPLLSRPIGRSGLTRSGVPTMTGSSPASRSWSRAGARVYISGGPVVPTLKYTQPRSRAWYHVTGAECAMCAQRALENGRARRSIVCAQAGFEFRVETISHYLTSHWRLGGGTFLTPVESGSRGETVSHICFEDDR